MESMKEAKPKRRKGKRPLRVCRYMHECCACDKDISDGQLYSDGGYGKRKHEPNCPEGSRPRSTRFLKGKPPK